MSRNALPAAVDVIETLQCVTVDQGLMAAASDPGSVLCVAGGIVRIAVHDGTGGAMRRNVDPLIGVASGEHERRNRQDDRDPHSRSSSPKAAVEGVVYRVAVLAFLEQDFAQVRARARRRGG